VRSHKTLVIVVLALTTLGGAWLAWRQYQELVVLRASVMGADERAALQKRIWDLERRNKQLSDRPAVAGGDMPPPPTGSPRPGGPRGGRGGGPGGDPQQMLNAVRGAMAKPEVQALMNVAQKAQIDTQYAALFRSLNLSPDQADKVKSLLLERSNTMMDVMTAAMEQGVNPRADPQGFQQLVANAQSDVNASLKAVVGDAGFSQLQNYDQTMPQRSVVNQLQQTLSYSDTPLTPAQAEQLVQVLAANPTPRANGAGGTTLVQSTGPSGQVVVSTTGDGGGPAGPGGMGAMFAGAFAGLAPGGGPMPTATVSPAAVAQSSSVLSAPQIAALQSIQQQQQAQQQLQQVMRDTFSGQNPNGGGGPPPGTAIVRKGGGG